jgi:hypothetical protein
MRRAAFLLTAVAMIVAMFSSTALAAVKFHAGPTFTDMGTTLNVTGNVSGLGNQDLTARLTATGIASVECYNPAGNRAPGQDTAVTTTGTQSNIEVKNGRATFNVTSAEPRVSSSACPNRKWTAEVIDVEFTSATLTLIQGGRTIFTQSYPQ